MILRQIDCSVFGNGFLGHIQIDIAHKKKGCGDSQWRLAAPRSRRRVAVGLVVALDLSGVPEEQSVTPRTPGD